MTQIPDIANLSAIAIIAIFAVKEFFAYLSGKKANGSNGQKIDLSAVNQKLDYLCKVAESPPNTAGQKTPEWWELAFARIVKQCLDDHETRIRRPAAEEATEMRQEILVAQKETQRQLTIAVTEILRTMRDGFNQR